MFLISYPSHMLNGLEYTHYHGQERYYDGAMAKSGLLTHFYI